MYLLYKTDYLGNKLMLVPHAVMQSSSEIGAFRIFSYNVNKNSIHGFLFFLLNYHRIII